MAIKDELYTWMKNLAFFYLMFSVFLHLVPDQSYEKYIRFFMGIMLIMMFCTPLLTILGKGEEFLESFSGIYEGEKRILEEKALQDIGEQYLRKSYEEEMERQIYAAFCENNLFAEKIEVRMNDAQFVVALLFGIQDQNRREEILYVLERKCGITDEVADIKIAFHEPEELDDNFSDWNTSDSVIYAN